jgi:hypothetical protein
LIFSSRYTLVLQFEIDIYHGLKSEPWNTNLAGNERLRFQVSYKYV